MKHTGLIILLITLMACNSNTSDLSSKFNSKNPGFLSLGIKQAQSFNPLAEHGKITQYKLTISGSAIENEIVNYYPVDTKEVSFKGFPHASTVRIKLEAINSNNICVRRGVSNDITITGGKNTGAEIILNNVPIFANVKDGATVYNNQFVPKVFAPGEIQFQLSDLHKDKLYIIEDQVNSLSQFSISKSVKDSVMPIYAKKFSVGTHTLTVTDDDTGESSTIKINVIDGSNKKALNSTSGNYLGSLISKTKGFQNNLITIQGLQTLLTDW